jgi:hypothetical protein
MKNVAQNSGIEVRAYPRSAQGVVSTPSTLHWKLVDKTSGQDVVPWTEVPVVLDEADGEIVEAYAAINIPGSANSKRSGKQIEPRVLLVVADKDSPREYSETWEYNVRTVPGR